MTSKLKTDILETVSGSGTIALTNQLSGMTTASLPTLTSTEMPAGSVINVYYHELSPVDIHTTSTSFVNTGLSITLTPLSASSRFLISYSHSPHGNTNTSWNQDAVFRGSTYTTIRGGMRFTSASGWRTYATTTSGVDSPNTTSAITYTVKFNNSGTTGYFHIAGHLVGGDASSNAASLTITEIKG